ncbi:hypothetical protein BN14_10707 [Rhizoctonia solani AG-1 IB]|uniref:NACHT domain-containing protein n=1 Tax=Thanatephorus cucumeris (strain AG1-IB / isolate 7/3/14) TaxID=1108050 RepID=M5CGR3_THACB|nr:hypothetical protein BN14_10707 [Rhizoctonia solani AG-1 IB]
MGLLSLSQAINRSKAKVKGWLKIDPKSTVSNITPVVQDMWPGLRSLLTQLESATGDFGPIKSAVGALASLADAFERDHQEQREYIEARKGIDRILKDISAHMKNPVAHMMTKSVELICMYAYPPSATHNIDQISRDITCEIAVMKGKQELGTERRLWNAMQGLDGVMDCCQRVHGHLERLTLNLNLDILQGINEQAINTNLKSMSPSMAAAYNSAESGDIKRGNCTPGTRKDQIDLLLKWARTTDAGKTCWMNGMAGTGKTTIAYTVCSKLEDACQLGASFFCSRTIPECRQVKHIIPSIAYQLARFSLPFRCALAGSLQKDPDAHTRALTVQYQKLIVEPLTEVQKSLPEDFIVVIDALDECENEDSVGQILDLLLSNTHTLPIRYLISSRPENEITRKMAKRLEGQDEAYLVLHNLDASSVRVDIEAYMRADLKDIPLSEDRWPSLLERSGVLFIYASTICRFIKQGYATHTLDEAVNTICKSNSIPMERDNPIDMLYLTILENAFERSALSKDNIKRTKDMLEIVICAIEPMTTDAMASLLDLKSGEQVYALLQPLRSVLNIPKTTGVVSEVLLQPASATHHYGSRVPVDRRSSRTKGQHMLFTLIIHAR